MIKWSLGGWLSGLGGSKFSKIVQIAIWPSHYYALCGHQVIPVCVSTIHRPPQTAPPGTAAILLAPLRLAVIESLPRRKVWCPKRRKVSKAKTASMPCNFVLTNRTTFLLRTVSEQREVSGQSISFIFQF